MSATAVRPVPAGGASAPDGDGRTRSAMPIEASRARPMDRSIGELLVDLSDGTAELVRQEIHLARSEAVEAMMSLRQGAVWMGIAAAMGLCATGTAVAFLVLVLSRYAMGGLTWLAALVVAVVLGIVGFVCIKRAQHAFAAAKRPPREAASSIRETVEWLRHPSRSAAS